MWLGRCLIGQTPVAASSGQWGVAVRPLTRCRGNKEEIKTVFFSPLIAVCTNYFLLAYQFRDQGRGGPELRDADPSAWFSAADTTAAA